MLAWKDKDATWQAHASRGIITRRAASCRARRARPPINKTTPPSSLTQFLLEPQGCLSVVRQKIGGFRVFSGVFG